MSERQDETQRRLQAAIAFWEELKAERAEKKLELDSAFYGKVKAAAIEVRVNGLLQTLASWLADSKDKNGSEDLSEISQLAVWLVEQLEGGKKAQPRENVTQFIKTYLAEERSKYRHAAQEAIQLLDQVKLVGEAWNVK